MAAVCRNPVVRMLEAEAQAIPRTSLASFVLKFGREYQVQPLPKRFRRGAPKQCFDNCYRLLQRRPNLIYVEGYATSDDLPITILHAWCVEKGSNLVIDPTKPMDHYFGIPFARQHVLQHRRNPDNLFTLIDDWKNGFPLLKLDSLEGIIERD